MHLSYSSSPFSSYCSLLYIFTSLPSSFYTIISKSTNFDVWLTTSSWRFVVRVVTSCGTLEIFRSFCITWCLHLPCRMRRKLPLEGRYMSTGLPGVTSQKNAGLIFIKSEYDSSDFVCVLYLHTCPFPFFLFFLSCKRWNFASFILFMAIPYYRIAQIPAARSSEPPNFVRCRILFVGPQLGTWFISSSCGQDFSSCF